MMMMMLTAMLCEGYVQYSVSTVNRRHSETASLSSQYVVNMHNNVLTEPGTEPGTEPVTVSVLDVNGSVVVRRAGASGELVINDVRLWWPYTMNNHSASYLYTLQVRLCQYRYLLTCNFSYLHVCTGVIC